MVENHLKIPPVYRQKNLHIIFCITLMAVMGVVSVTPAFPKIVEALHISMKEIGLLITVFTFPGVLLTPVLGVLADRFGRKRILVPSLFLFGLAGIACAFSRDFHTLLIFRFFQGVGAASLGSLNATLIGDLYHGHQLNEAMGYNSSVLNLGTGSYPAIGGFLAIFGWNYPFLMPVVAVPVGLWVLFSLKNPEPKKEQNLKTYLKIALKCFQNKKVLGLFGASLITFIIIYGPLITYIPFYMQKFFNSPSWVIGLMLSATSIGSGITSWQMGRLTKRYSKKKLILWAGVCYIVSMATVPMVRNVWLMLVPSTICGIGNGLNLPCVQSLLATMAPLEYRGAFMSANGMVLRLGQTLGPLTMAAVLVFSSLTGVFIAGVCWAIVFILLIQLTL